MSGEKIYEIECKLNDFLNKRTGLGKCTLKSNTGAFIELYNSRRDIFPYKLRSLRDCFISNRKTIPADLTPENTLWVELLKNGTIESRVKGIGKKFLDIIKTQALRTGYKYIFLYPSKLLGGQGANQDRLIEYYVSVGFEKLNSCNHWDMDWSTERIKNFGPINHDDGEAPYHLMFAKIEDLDTDSPDFASAVIDYKTKYLKYKAKYLELKNSIA
jgi:hypothetical protein